MSPGETPPKKSPIIFPIAEPHAAAGPNRKEHTTGIAFAGRRSPTARPSACCATSGEDRSSGYDQVIGGQLHLDADQYPDRQFSRKRSIAIRVRYVEVRSMR